MIGLILELLAGAVTTDFIVTKTTGNHIHEHLFKWWCEVRDYINQWLQAHANLRVRRLGLAVLDNIDGVAVRTKQMADRVTLGWFAVSSDENAHEICTREVSTEEAVAEFPDLQFNPVLIQELH